MYTLQCEGHRAINGGEAGKSIIETGVAGLNDDARWIWKA